MAAMIQNDEEKEWMKPLLDFRNRELKPENLKDDHEKRDFRRMKGHVSLYPNTGQDDEDRSIPGPYTQIARADFLRKLLKVQMDLRQNEFAPKEVHNLDLISLDELHEIRRIWVTEKHEIEDLLPDIFESVVGQGFPKRPLDDRQPFDQEDMELLKDLCDGDDLHFELVRELLDVERGYRSKSRRSNLIDRIEKAFRKSFYENADDATQRAVRRREFQEVLEGIKQGEMEFDSASKRITELTEVSVDRGAS